MLVSLVSSAGEEEHHIDMYGLLPHARDVMPKLYFVKSSLLR
jgi:hypothetical protein